MQNVCSEGRRLPKPDWDQFNPRCHNPSLHVPRRPPPQKRPTVFSSYYSKKETNTSGNNDAYQPRPPQFNPNSNRSRPYNRGGHSNKPMLPHIMSDNAGSNYPPALIPNQQHHEPVRFDPTQPLQPYQNWRPERSEMSFKRRGGGRPRYQKNKKQQRFNNTFSDSYGKPEAILEKRCCECGDADSSYKCPLCLLKYCSVSCYKAHKGGINCISTMNEETVMDKNNEVNCKLIKSPQKISLVRGRVEYLYPTVDTIKPEALEKLAVEDSLRSRVVDLLKSQGLRDKIRRLDLSEDPRKLMDSFVEDKEFSEFKTFVIDNLSKDLFR